MFVCFQKSLEDVYLGPECEEALKEIPLPSDPEKKWTREQLADKRKQDITQFRLKCLDFYVTAAKQIQTIFPIGKPIIQEMEFVDPKVALDEKARDVPHLRDLSALSNNFKVILTPHAGVATPRMAARRDRRLRARGIATATSLSQTGE